MSSKPIGLPVATTPVTVMGNEVLVIVGLMPLTDTIMVSVPADRDAATVTIPVLESIAYLPPTLSASDHEAVPVNDPVIETVPTTSAILAPADIVLPDMDIDAVPAFQGSSTLFHGIADDFHGSDGFCQGRLVSFQICAIRF